MPKVSHPAGGIIKGYRNAGLLSPHSFFSFFKKDFICLFLQRGEGQEKKRGKHQCVVAPHATPTGDPAPNPGMCPDWESNWWPFGSQASAQSTEPHQPGLTPHSLLCSTTGLMSVLVMVWWMKCVSGIPSWVHFEHWVTRILGDFGKTRLFWHLKVRARISKY